MWCDLVRLLRHFGKDIHCPKYVCPTDLKKAHDLLVRKREEQIERERAEQRREQLVKDEKNYLKSKGKFFGLVFTDNLILVKVIESVAEMQLEGKLMHHCVGGYYKGLLAHFTQIYHLYNLLIYNILRRNLQLFITEFCIFSPCIIFISNKNSDKSIEILHISPKYITSVDNLMIHIFSSTFNFLYSFTPSDRLESKS